MRSKFAALGFFLAAFVITTGAQVYITPPLGSGGSGTIVGGSCTDQVVTAIAVDGSPTCSDIALAMADSSTGTGSFVFSDSPTFSTLVNLGTTGVRITPSASQLTLLGLDGTAENLIIDFDGVLNDKIYLSSSTGNDTLRWIGAATDGTFLDLFVTDGDIEIVADDGATGYQASVFVFNDYAAVGVSTGGDYHVALETNGGTPNIHLGATGVLLTSDNDGSIAILGKGDGFDENLVINLDDTTNIIALSSSTGAEALNWNGSTATAAKTTLTIMDNYSELFITSGVSADDSILLYSSSNDSYIALNASATNLVDLQTTATQSLIRILHDSKSYLQMGAVTFANLGTPANGTITYCSNCTLASPCASGGTGALAKRLNTTWVCN